MKLTRPHRWGSPLLAAAAVVALAATGAPAAAAATERGAKATRSKAERKKAAARRTLRRRVRRNPAAVLRPHFLRVAAEVDFDLPVTARLNPALDSAPTFAASNDSFQLDLGSGATAPPAPAGRYAGAVTTTLSGGFAAFMKFGRDTSGFGRLGVIELGFGPATIDASGVDLVVGDPPCGDGPLLRTDPTVTVAAHPAGGSYGSLDLFGQVFHLDLRTRFSFPAAARASCAGTLAPTALLSGAALPPVVLRADGRFRMSPAITADGRLRLGRLTLTAAQEQLGGFLHSCATAPPGADPCDGGPDDLAIPVQTQAVALSAEILVGPAPS